MVMEKSNDEEKNCLFATAVHFNRIFNFIVTTPLGVSIRIIIRFEYPPLYSNGTSDIYANIHSIFKFIVGKSVMQY